MKRAKALFAFILPLVLSSFLTSCGGDDAGVNGDLLDITVPGAGFILPVAGQSCTDVQSSASGTSATYSLTSPSMTFYKIILTWKPNDFDLNLPSVTLTLTSNRLIGGHQVIALAPVEIEKLFGAKANLFSRSPWSGGSPRLTPIGAYSSQDASATKSLDSATKQMYPCTLAVGGLQLADPTNTSSFSASVRIDLIGVAYANASNADPSAQKVVRKSIQTTATYN